MLHNFNSHPGHIEYLPLLVAARFYFFQRSMAVTALPYSMNLDVIRTLHRFQGMPANAASWFVNPTFP
jgi:hypothetical protein